MQARQSSLLEIDEAYPLATGDLVVDAGIVWITESGREADLFLRKGQRHFSKAARRGIMQALEPGTRVTFHPAPGLRVIPDTLLALKSALGTLFKDRLNLGPRC